MNSKNKVNKKDRISIVNMILGMLSLAFLSLVWLVGCFQSFVGSIESGCNEHVMNAASAKNVFASCMLIVGIFSFLNITLRNKIYQLISLIFCALSIFLPICVEIVLDSKIPEYCQEDINPIFYKNTLTLSIIGFLFLIMCLCSFIYNRNNYKSRS